MTKSAVGHVDRLASGEPSPRDLQHRPDPPLTGGRRDRVDGGDPSDRVEREVLTANQDPPSGPAVIPATLLAMVGSVVIITAPWAS